MIRFLKTTNSSQSNKPKRLRIMWLHSKIRYSLSTTLWRAGFRKELSFKTRKRFAKSLRLVKETSLIAPVLSFLRWRKNLAVLRNWNWKLKCKKLSRPLALDLLPKLLMKLRRTSMSTSLNSTFYRLWIKTRTQTKSNSLKHTFKV